MLIKKDSHNSDQLEGESLGSERKFINEFHASGKKRAKKGINLRTPSIRSESNVDEEDSQPLCIEEENRLEKLGSKCQTSLAHSDLLRIAQYFSCNLKISPP
jgi:hypothetical protein